METSIGSIIFRNGLGLVATTVDFSVPKYCAVRISAPLGRPFIAQNFVP
jgi:hypothetical protein